MTEFIRVKSASRRDAQHKFDVSVEVAERHPERYTVVDPEPVKVPRPVEYTLGRSEAADTITPVSIPLVTADPVVEIPSE